MRTLLVCFGLLLMSLMAEAQPLISTQNGTANATSLQLFSFTASGPVDISISWTKRNANLFVILTCDIDGEAIPYGVASAVLQQNAFLTSGVIPGLPCVIGVTSADLVSAFRLHVTSGASHPTTRNGRERLEVGAPSWMARVTEDTAATVRKKLLSVPSK